MFSYREFHIGDEYASHDDVCFELLFNGMSTKFIHRFYSNTIINYQQWEEGRKKAEQHVKAIVEMLNEKACSGE